MTQETTGFFSRHIFSTPEENWNGRFEWYKEMRNTSPIMYDEKSKCWDIFLYEDVESIIKNKELFSSERPVQQGEPSILSLDPPRHTQLRSLVSKAFTPRELKLWKPRIKQITYNLVKNIKEKEEFDLIKDLAYPLPVMVIADILGVPEQDMADFKRWSDILVASPENSSVEALESLKKLRIESIKQMDMYFEDIIKQKRAHTTTDLISILLDAEIENEKLSDQEIKSFCRLLLAAGNETTTNLIGNTMYGLLEERNLYNQLQENPEDITLAIEEGLRYRSPVQALNRIAKEDVDIKGHKIKAGDALTLWVGSANRDENKFTNSDQFIINRTPNQHLSFGKGIHFCLGAPLARLEGQIAFEELMKELPGIHIPKDFKITPIQSAFVFGLKQFPLKIKGRC
ncbi:cytochrome P450 [Priestia megaterium]|uniref:cytochrome P450 n=1 Tax=Priestia megaterium TaxID=1404 RepID=UPI00207955CF|nr:cytochrome P450 [Priestia megaterium]USL27533.1 cytochrome P450 [Priestia megaterium]USL33428.1 cytochrome P450 [Priestia megaterium]USL39360.1 cytochrome P450 [Priestia megaterium]WDM31519.1 cytochrome P450 [Priestia megaterium]